MSYQDGIAAIRLEMPDIIPRTEYSADMHWNLITAVTGLYVDEHSSGADRSKAVSAFVKAWDYGFIWNVLTGRQIFGDIRTDMGHAVYAAHGTDFSTDIHELFEDPEDVFKFDLYEVFGTRDIDTLTREYDENYDAQCLRYPDCVNMTGIYVTCISGLIELLGWNTLLLAAGMNPKEFGAFILRYTNWIQQYFNALACSKAPVVMVHDDIVWTSGAFMHPDFYRQYVFSSYKKLFKPLHESGKRIIFTSDGTFTEFIDDLAELVHGFVLEPTTDLSYLAERYGKTHVIIGNADTRVLKFGSRDDIRDEVRRCMDIGRKCPGFIMAVGNHIPPDTPVERALYYNECYMEMRKR